MKERERKVRVQMKWKEREGNARSDRVVEKEKQKGVQRVEREATRVSETGNGIRTPREREGVSSRSVIARVRRIGTAANEKG